jgi:N-formylglutamate amidohydrolase
MTHCIFHVPHSSRQIPKIFRDQFTIDDRALTIELDKLTDHFTDSMVEGVEATKVIFPYSRLLVDVERFADDALEPMSERGMGVIYSNGHALNKIRRDLNDDEREELIALYWKHHNLLEKSVDDALEQFNKCMIIDLHSYPRLKLPYEPSDGVRPELCIGTDNFHTPDNLVSEITSIASKYKLDVTLNTPFAGTLVPLKHYGKEPRVNSVMLEIRRDQYMDESSMVVDNERINLLKSMLTDIVLNT